MMRITASLWIRQFESVSSGQPTRGYSSMSTKLPQQSGLRVANNPRVDPPHPHNDGKLRRVEPGSSGPPTDAVAWLEIAENPTTLRQTHAQELAERLKAALLELDEQAEALRRERAEFQREQLEAALQMDGPLEDPDSGTAAAQVQELQDAVSRLRSQLQQERGRWQQERETWEQDRRSWETERDAWHARQRQQEQQAAELRALQAEQDSRRQAGEAWHVERQELLGRCQALEERTTLLEQRERQVESEAKRLEQLANRLAREERALDEARTTQQRDRQQRESEANWRDQQRQQRVQKELESLRLLRRQLENAPGANPPPSFSVIREQTKLEARQEQLDELERVLQSHYAELERVRTETRCRREQDQLDLHERRQRLLQRAQRIRQQQQKARLELQQQAAQLGKQRESLQQLRGDIHATHQSTLELRLVIEYLWNECAEQLDPAKRTQALTRIQTQLAELYQWREQELVERGNTLRELAAELEGHQTRLQRMRRDLNQWLERRHRELESLASRLVDREEQLDHQEAYLRRVKDAWDAKKLSQQAEIRRLLRDQKVA